VEIKLMRFVSSSSESGALALTLVAAGRFILKFATWTKEIMSTCSMDQNVQILFIGLT